MERCSGTTPALGASLPRALVRHVGVRNGDRSILPRLRPSGFKSRHLHAAYNRLRHILCQEKYDYQLVVACHSFGCRKLVNARQGW